MKHFAEKGYNIDQNTNINNSNLYSYISFISLNVQQQFFLKTYNLNRNRQLKSKNFLLANFFLFILIINLSFSECYFTKSRIKLMNYDEIKRVKISICDDLNIKRNNCNCIFDESNKQLINNNNKLAKIDYKNQINNIKFTANLKSINDNIYNNEENIAILNQFFYGVPFFGNKAITKRICNCKKIKMNINLCEEAKENPYFHIVSLELSNSLLNKDNDIVSNVKLNSTNNSEKAMNYSNNTINTIYTNYKDNAVNLNKMNLNQNFNKQNVSKKCDCSILEDRNSIFCMKQCASVKEYLFDITNFYKKLKNDSNKIADKEINKLKAELKNNQLAKYNK